MIKHKSKIFEKYIEDKGLKSTRQRDDIINTFLKSDGHLTIEDLLHLVKKVNSKIGYATVYRTLKLLADSGLAAERKFEDGQTRYEHADPGEHHDHLICLSCGSILEFEEERIETLQDEVAKRFGFEVVNHNLELYGYCKKCKKGRIDVADKH